ncbi:hypothetical protein OV079_01030 [Nannocystis pusilla]|uniref:Uncharacterized protein n=1 Tax=Nannocystis pusilla TaxID=889268 RepID=A0A9X3EI85_9BACT|nr:hypothetical protein [Nannocystis pusilla]MCY1004171.1 hypothetical protein [Nannocystis pusilla]
MFAEYLEDLDALVLSCRSLQSKTYLQESVRAYRASAYRASIVACWIAVVCDYIHKLEELSLGGDAQAQNQLQILSKARDNQNVQGLLDFEKRVLDNARDSFAFISASEHHDLARLQEDRNRCAHPAFDSNGQLFNPPAELARLHILKFRSHSPRASADTRQFAIQTLAADVESVHFPKHSADAIKHFKHGPLSRPRMLSYAISF